MTLIKWSPRRTSIFDEYNIFSPTLSNNWTHVNKQTDYWTPPVDVKEDDTEFYIMVDLPGISKNDIAINLKNNILTLSSNYDSKDGVENGTFHYRERRTGKFHRTFKIPSIIEEEKIVASFKNGFLEILLPKSEESVTREREIKIK